MGVCLLAWGIAAVFTIERDNDKDSGNLERTLVGKGGD